MLTFCENSVISPTGSSLLGQNVVMPGTVSPLVLAGKCAPTVSFLSSTSSCHSDIPTLPPTPAGTSFHSMCRLPRWATQMTCARLGQPLTTSEICKTPASAIRTSGLACSRCLIRVSEERPCGMRIGEKPWKAAASTMCQ